MKKTAVVAIVLLALTISGCGIGAKTPEEVQHVIEQIDTIGEVSVSDKNTVDAIYEEYNALTDEQKEKVTNYQVLADAKTSIHKLIESHPFALFDFGWDTTIAQDKGIECADKKLHNNLSRAKAVNYNDCSVNGYSFSSIKMSYKDDKLNEIWIYDHDGADKVSTYLEMFQDYYGDYYRKTDTDDGYLWLADNCTVILDAYPSDSNDHSLQIEFLPAVTNDGEKSYAESKYENMVSSHEGLGDIILEIPDTSGN